MNPNFIIKTIFLIFLISNLNSCSDIIHHEPNRITCYDFENLVVYRFIFIREKDTMYFNAATSDTNVIAKADNELIKPFKVRLMHINGILSPGECNYSPNYDWHFIPNQWDLVESSIEWCDAFPENPDITGIERVCPWSSRVYMRLSLK
jgi:hypothetical protein